MSIVDWISLVACVAHLGLAALVLLRGGRSPLALPLGLLALNEFVWNAGDFAWRVSDEMFWHWLDLCTSPLTGALGIHVVVSFVGMRRRLRGVLLTAYGSFGFFSLATFTALWFEETRSFPGSDVWNFIYLGLILPTAGFMVVILRRYMRSTVEPMESLRAKLIFLAFGLGAILGSTDVMNGAGMAVPRLSNLGALVATLLVFFAVRYRLFDQELPFKAVAGALALGVLGVGGYLVVFEYFAAQTGTLLFGIASVTLGLVLAVVQLVAVVSARRQRLTHLATLGRYSAQMAHDVKNPLTAMKAAVQYIEGESDDKTLGESREELELLAGQVDRMIRVIDRYQGIGRIEVRPEPVRVNDVIEQVLSLERARAGDAIDIELELLESLPPIRADRELLARVIENLVSNAFDAMKGGGTLTVTTSCDDDDVVITVRDTGVGMDPRVQEQAFDDFYTTRAEGSGLGLAFVRRVLEAHHGRVSMSSQKGHGTVLWLRLPIH